jgi:hypothetical protein
VVKRAVSFVASCVWLRATLVTVVAIAASALVGCGSSGTTGGHQSEPDSGGAEDGGSVGDASAGGETSMPASDAPAPDVGTTCRDQACDAGADSGPHEAGSCPASCKTFSDCASCPQPNFGGWSCNGGVCQFMG